MPTQEKLCNPDRPMLTFRKELNDPIMLSFSVCWSGEPREDNCLQPQDLSPRALPLTNEPLARAAPLTVSLFLLPQQLMGSVGGRGHGNL